jgi:protein-L-isoaspartate(D-aspartate) O-methyltransferase
VTKLIDADTDAGQAAELREGLVNELVADGTIVSTGVQTAFRTVFRHVFTPGVPLAEAYANETVRTKRDEKGVTISSVSAPWLQASMLEQADLRHGMRALEIGSGGYNAALMRELVGPDGQVTTVDIDSDVVDRARACLTEAGYTDVHVVLADAEVGVQEHAPYDRIIVTVGVWDLPPAWTDQLAPGGRLVVPLRMRGLGRTISFDLTGDHLVSRDHAMAGFVSVQGAGEHNERLVLLHGEDVGLRIDEEGHAVDAEGLSTSLLKPRVEAWTGVRFAGAEPFDGLFLWLATVFDDFCLISRQRTDAARALIDPASPNATPTILRGHSFAYLTFREVAADSFEFGAYAHGPDAADLAEKMAEQIRVWDGEHRHGPGAQIAVYPAGTPDAQLPRGRIIDKRHTRVLISWS